MAIGDRGGETEWEQIQVGSREEGQEAIQVGKHALRPNIRPASLPRWRKFHIDIFPQIVDDEPLFIVSEYGAHHIFIPIVLLSQ